jgi:hypothetical protein
MRNGGQNGRLRADLVRQADEMRTKLARTVERIDQRRHDAFDLRKQVERHLRQLAIAAGVVVVGAAGLSAYLGYRVVTAGHRRRQARLRLAKSMWTQPDRRLRAARGSFAAEVLRSLAFTAVTTLLSMPLRRLLRPAERDEHRGKPAERATAR